MGFLNKKPIIKTEGFHPIDLNEDNVQAIFNRCLAVDDTPKEKVSRSILFSRTLGYKPEDEIVFYCVWRMLSISIREENGQTIEPKCWNCYIWDVRMKRTAYRHSM